MGYPSPMQSVSIPVEEGVELEGRLEGSDSGPPVVVCHPHPAFGGTLDAPIVEAIAAALVRAGLLVLRFNFRGIGRSTGTPTGGLVEHRDVRAACAWLRARAAPDLESTLSVVGYSFGGLMAARAIADGERAHRFVTLGLPTTIVGDNLERIAHITAAHRAAPTLHVVGDRDQFCEVDRLRAWAAAVPGTRVDVLPGVSHFPSGAPLDDAVARIVAFLAA